MVKKAASKMEAPGVTSEAATTKTEGTASEATTIEKKKP